MEVTDLSELCRLCLESSSILFPFETKVRYTPKSLLQLIKFCLDIDCTSNDGGIAPKNVCQSCLDKLQFVHEFKSKSQESDRYLKQIITHSTINQAPLTIIEEDEPIITPYSSYPDDDDSLLQPLDDYDEDYVQNGSGSTKALKLARRGTRSGEFECKMCSKSFRYSKAYNKHMKMHKATRSPVNYYQRKKLMLATEKNKAPPKPTSTAASSRKESQPAYDTTSPYQSPAPYEIDSPEHSQQRDSSPDFGALMLSTSQLIRDDDLEQEEKEIPKTSRTGRILKRPAMDTDLYKPNGGQKRNRPSIPLKKTQIAEAPAKPPPKKEEIPLRKPGPLSSKTRSKPVEQKQDEDNEEGFTIEGFSEVDISKMLKKAKNRSSTNVEMIDEGSQSHQSSSSVRSRNRSPSVELIDEIDIFGGRS